MYNVNSYNLWGRIKNTLFSAGCACIIIIISVVFLFVITIISFSNIDMLCSGVVNYNLLNATIAFVMVLIAIANAILLYSTLHNSRKSFVQERFETQFFNILNHHSNIIENIRVERVAPYDDYQLYMIKAKGRICFYYILEQFRIIYTTLSYKRWEGYAEDNDADGIQYIQQKEEYSEKELNAQYEYCLRRLVNKFYSIKEETHKEFSNLTSAKEKYALCFRICMNIWKPDINHYIRYTIQVMRFIEKYPNEKEFYVNAFGAQLSENEMSVLYLFCLFEEYYCKNSMPINRLANSLGIYNVFKSYFNRITTYNI